LATPSEEEDQYLDEIIDWICKEEGELFKAIKSRRAALYQKFKDQPGTKNQETLVRLRAIARRAMALAQRRNQRVDDVVRTRKFAREITTYWDNPALRSDL
jgi:hypothetical protein